MWADKVAGIWGERAETEDLFLALIYYGTSLLFIVIGNYLPKIKQLLTIYSVILASNNSFRIL